MHGFHLGYQENNWFIKGKSVRAKVEQTAGINPVTKTGSTALNISTGDYNMYAWYIESGYKIFQYGTNQKNYLMFIARYDIVDINDQVSFTPFHRKRNTVGLEWSFTTNMRLRYEFQKNKLLDNNNAPVSYISAGGKENINMHMTSIIAFLSYENH